jgi:hypothetical protein
MAYTPLRGARPPQQKTDLSTMPTKGMNKFSASQFLGYDKAKRIENYRVEGEGKFTMRKGLERKFSDSGENSTLFRQFVNNKIFIYAHDDKIKAWNKSTDAIETIHTFSISSTYEGERYGDYFFITNKKEKIGRISRTLAYDAQTSNFAVGEQITGGTSGATAIVLEDSDSGATGTLTLGSVVGAFEDNEAISGSAGGAATVDGVIGWSYTTIASAPICNNLKVIYNRLLAVGTRENPTGGTYSAVDDGSNPPFDDWTVGTLADDADEIFSRNVGNALSAELLGDVVVIFGETGKYAFRIDTISVGSDLKKTNTQIIDRRDFGGSRASELTARGLLYANETGLWQLRSLGQPNIPYSDQESNLTDKTLGVEFFKDIDLSNADIIYDSDNDTAYLTCAKNSVVNNLVIAYNFENNAVTLFTGWNIARFENVNDDEIFAISALEVRGYKCFTGATDDGKEIYTELTFELPNGISTNQDFLGMYTQGFLSLSSPLSICFNKWNLAGKFEENAKCFTWSAEVETPEKNGWGAASYGGSSWGGNSNAQDRPDGTIEAFGGMRWPIRGFQRLECKITSASKQLHEITWIELQTRPKSQITRRNISVVSN